MPGSQCVRLSGGALSATPNSEQPDAWMTHSHRLSVSFENSWVERLLSALQESTEIYRPVSNQSSSRPYVPQFTFSATVVLVITGHGKVLGPCFFWVWLHQDMDDLSPWYYSITSTWNLAPKQAASATTEIRTSSLLRNFLMPRLTHWVGVQESWSEPEYLLPPSTIQFPPFYSWSRWESGHWKPLTSTHLWISAAPLLLLPSCGMAWLLLGAPAESV